LRRWKGNHLVAEVLLIMMYIKRFLLPGVSFRTRANPVYHQAAGIVFAVVHDSNMFVDTGTVHVATVMVHPFLHVSKRKMRSPMGAAQHQARARRAHRVGDPLTPLQGLKVRSIGKEAHERQWISYRTPGTWVASRTLTTVRTSTTVD
jgi:hypothetical protein